jgi:hypothetical protein
MNNIELLSHLKLAINATRRVNKAQGAHSAECKAIADIIAADHNPMMPYKDEHKRLIAEAKAIAVKAKVADDRNTWQHVSTYLVLAMNPTVLVETTVKEKGKEPTTAFVPAEDCAGSVAKARDAAKQVRESLGLVPERAKPAPKKGVVETPSDHAASVVEWMAHETDRKAITAALKAAGYRLTKITKRKAKASTVEEQIATELRRTA